MYKMKVERDEEEEDPEVKEKGVRIKWLKEWEKKEKIMQRAQPFVRKKNRLRFHTKGGF